MKCVVDDACAPGFCEQLGAEAEQPSGGDVEFQVYLAIAFAAYFSSSLCGGQDTPSQSPYSSGTSTTGHNGFTAQSIDHFFDDPGA